MTHVFWPAWKMCTEKLQRCSSSTTIPVSSGLGCKQAVLILMKSEAVFPVTEAQANIYPGREGGEAGSGLATHPSSLEVQGLLLIRRS